MANLIKPFIDGGFVVINKIMVESINNDTIKNMENTANTWPL